ncbi:5-formyltetrahydrofolate cyclo-ligase [Gloeocapsa sp. PCC 73106]|uniref:5-formyltetrahydrofolate cyclo-ligase n=1 Tax=Gloeocapsa sp. PCC 73106 TaxID=102232 RepID=UPI0002ABC0AE|nr:5-formyltetrahydrofolate cyclo-ligase [Gloeocapsa sp. PCC 73106]ELR96634.1 5,10-methenyltetrahydrofolate synthetase [Gloeocapsa sp. PCC 73106]
MNDQKQHLRQQLLQQRRSLSQEVWRQQSDLLCERLQSWSGFQTAQSILAYFSIQQEPDLSPLFAQKHWGFPRCVDKSLSWYWWQQGDLLTPGAYGILEPEPTAPKVTPEQVDLILVPAVACDFAGYRLGYGGGFYDRLLAQPQWSSLKAIGIVFDFAYLPQLPVDSWDQKLDGVCTDSRISD